MAATKTGKNRTSRNDTPNTPDVSESKIARMKVDELRRALKNRGVTGTAELKKPELVKKLIKAEKAGAKKSVSSAKKAGSSRGSTSRNDTPNTPGVSESKIAGMKVDQLRRELKDLGVKGTAELRKPELVKKLKRALTGTSRTTGSGGKRAGKKAASSLKYAQEIKSTDDRPERAGRSLVTTDHAVIRQWAEARNAAPASVAGSEHNGHLGVLRFDFPGYGGDRLTHVSWDDWFEAFDKRRLNFIFQQRLSSGKRSNFFRLENPHE